ncbi:MAG: DNA replication/repair protein RecF [Woeseia sp.]
MALRFFSCTDFRCVSSVNLEPDARYNLIYGSNASGKTSLLEAIACLGRGKSFRGAPTDRLVRHGASEFLLFGRVEEAGRAQTIGVRNGRCGLEISIDGDRSGGTAALAMTLPLQVVDPEVHNLVAGGPEHRRRYLDWIAFHVEPDYLRVWRRFRRVLRQRNAALRSGADLRGWDPEFTEGALAVHEARQRALEQTLGALERTGRRLLGSRVGFEYTHGWNAGLSFPEALAAGLERDQQTGTTQSGPQRADLRLVYDERQARKLVSRGQQKLLACAMILAATEVAQEKLGRSMLLLLDDPAAELDEHSLERLMQDVAALQNQVIATSLEPEPRLFPEAPARFHVERGTLSPG